VLLLIGLIAYNEMIQRSDSMALGLVPTFLFLLCRAPYFGVLGFVYEKHFYRHFVELSAAGAEEPPFHSAVEHVIANLATFGAIMFQVAKGIAVMMDAVQDDTSKRWLLSALFSSGLSMLTRSGLLHRISWGVVSKDPAMAKPLAPMLCPGALMTAGTEAMHLTPWLFASVFATIGVTRAIMFGDLRAVVFADVSENAMMAYFAQTALFFGENLALRALNALGQLRFPKPEHIPQAHPLRNFEKPELPLVHAFVTVALVFNFLWVIILSLLGPNFVLGLCAHADPTVPERWFALEALPSCP
jgi:hypothetical protein